MVAHDGTYGSVTVSSPLPSPSTEPHPERTCSWFSWLFMLFHEELFRQKHPPPAPWRRLFTRHSPRIASIDDVVPLPLEWQGAAAKRALSSALDATNGDVVAAVLKVDRPEMLRAHAWSLASGVLRVAYAVALLELLGAVTSSDDRNRVRRVTALVLCVIVARMAEGVARQHGSLSSVHLKVRVICGLFQLVMERAVRTPWAQLVGEEVDIPPGVYIRELHIQIERVCGMVESKRDFVGDVIRLIANWFVLEWYVHHYTGSMLVLAALLLNGCTSALARYRWEGWQLGVDDEFRDSCRRTRVAVVATCPAHCFPRVCSRVVCPTRSQ